MPIEVAFLHVPRWSAERREIMVMPLGLPALANLLADRGRSCAILHLGLEREADPSFSLTAWLQHHQPRIVCLSLHWHPQTRAVIDTAERVRTALPDSRILVGGLTASVFARELAESVRCIDGVVRGDGEVPLIEAVRVAIDGHGSWERVPNLVWRDARGVVRDNGLTWALDAGFSASLRHGDLQLLQHLDRYLARPLYADFSEGSADAQGYAGAAYLNAGRGCTASCASCGGASQSQRDICRRTGLLLYPIDKLVRDVREAAHHGATTLRVSFDPPAARAHNTRWFDAIDAQRWRPRLVYDCWYLPTIPLLDRMARTFAPGSLVVLSPECGSERLRQRIRGLPFRNASLLRAVRAAEARGLRVHCFFSAGLPGETPDDLDETARLIQRIHEETSAAVSVCPMFLDPGSPVFREPERWGVRLVRKTLGDFYDSKGIPEGPGYETDHFDERGILEACRRLLTVAAGAWRGRAPVESGDGSSSRARALLVGWFRSVVPEGHDGPFGGQGGFVDALGPVPYSLANACLQAYAQADPEVTRRWELERLDLAEPLELEDDREEVEATAEDVERIVARAPHVVAFSGYCWNLDAIRQASRALKERIAGARIVLGGRVTLGAPESLLRELPDVDVLVLGEGEIPFRELLRRDFDGLESCPGVVFREGNEIVRGAPPASVGALDEIPSPYLAGLLAPPLHAMMLELSRGCLHGCGYCTWNADKRLRFAGPERVEEVIRWAKARGHRHITLTDSAVNYDTEALALTVDAIRRADPEGDVRFTYNLRHDRIDAAQLELLSRLPTHMVLCGVETLAEGGMEGLERETVDAVALRATLREIARVTRPPVASIVLGLPHDTEEGFRRTLDTLLSWCEPVGSDPPAVGAVLVSLLQVYRGSGLWERAGELGIRYSEKGIPYLIESPAWSREALARCKSLLIERMGEEPDRLKAAEAIALSSVYGGADPWLTRGRVGRLLSPWERGETREGWTLEKIGMMRDTGRGFLVRFAWKGGGGVRIRMRRRAAGDDARRSTRFYTLDASPTRGPMAPVEDVKRLVRLVFTIIRRNEEAIVGATPEMEF